MTTLHKYRVYCTTSGSYQYVWLEDTEDAPTSCPVDPAHTIDASQTSIIETVGPDAFELKSDPKAPPAVASDFPPVREQAHYVSHNFCDPATWYQKSTRVIGATTSRPDPALSPNRYTLDSPPDAEQVIINTHKGLVNQEDVLPEVRAHEFVVYVDGVRKKIAGLNATAFPNTSNWADYGYEVEVDWSDGSLQFKDDVSPGVVTVDYSHVDTTLSKPERSMFVVKPFVMRSIRMLKAETQFANGLDLKDTLIFTAFTPLTFQGIQTDATLDPGVGPASGTRYRIDDASNLHANFGTIDRLCSGDYKPLANGDIVEYDSQRGWGIIFDAQNTAGTVYALNVADSTFHDWNGSAWVAGSPKTLAMLTKVEAHGHRKAYKTIQDYWNEATGNYPTFPGGMVTGARGESQDAMQLPWNWIGTKLMEWSKEFEIRMWLDNGIPFDGPYVTATFYCQVFDS